MSKAARIRELLQETDLSNQEIAEKVGCLDSYVRVVQQRLQGVEHTLAWRDKNRERWLEYRAGYMRQYRKEKASAA
jgi:hypothetical protein